VGGAGGRRRVSGLSSFSFEARLRSERERREDPLFPSPPFAKRERARELEGEGERGRERERKSFVPAAVSSSTSLSTLKNRGRFSTTHHHSSSFKVHELSRARSETCLIMKSLVQKRNEIGSFLIFGR
jgi:hypothetical protein